ILTLQPGFCFFTRERTNDFTSLHMPLASVKNSPHRQTWAHTGEICHRTCVRKKGDRFWYPSKTVPDDRSSFLSLVVLCSPLFRQHEHMPFNPLFPLSFNQGSGSGEAGALSKLANQRGSLLFEPLAPLLFLL